MKSSLFLRAAAIGCLALLALPSLAATQGSSRSKVRRHVLSGEIAAYDKEAQTLTLKTARGKTDFAVGEAKVYLEAKSVGLEEIAAELGAKASVTYTMKNGKRQASSVRIKAPRPRKG